MTEDAQHTGTKTPVVMCMKWGTLYSSSYVNVLHRAVKDHLAMPHRFVCFTDDESGIVDGVECFPLPDPLLKNAFTRMGCWPKVTLFKKDLFGLEGRALFMDLDTVVLGDLTPFLTKPGRLIAIKEWGRFADFFRKQKLSAQTSVFSFDLGQMSHIYDAYARDPEAAANNFRNEQRFVTHSAEELEFWDSSDVVSFKRHLLAPPIVNRFVKPKTPSEGTKVLVFHGNPRPRDVIREDSGRWGGFWQAGRGPVPYVRDYWVEYGGIT
ncbi:MAG: hypothetical protein AAF890_04395 [Pseudomonadota bacterium]